MKKYEIETAERCVMTEITCDKCGDTVNTDDVLEAQEWTCVRIDGGFSSVFGDGAQLACDLCQACTKDLLGQYMRDVSDA